MSSRYAELTREQLAVLVPELLLLGQMIDRSGMAWCISNFGRPEMLQIAIEEWMGASPIYTKRMQKALGFEGDDVITIFKGLQLDIGAPPQFMDFRYTLHDRWHGEFHLDHCGALLDVEPMGEEYVRGMCHDIEDPTFDATAVATNRRAQIRPIHRPPRTPADRHPHCAWTVIIDESHPPVTDHPVLDVVRRTRAARTELDPIDPGGPGQHDYSGELRSDFDFAAFSHSALVRMADEVCLQMHLLNLSFVIAVGKRAGTDLALATEICTKQLIGIAGLAAERIHRALGLPEGIEGRAGDAANCTRCSTRRRTSTAEFGPDTVRGTPVAGPRGRRVGVADPPRRAAPAAGRGRRRRSASGRADDRHRHRLDRARRANATPPARNSPRCRWSRSAGARHSSFAPRKSLPLTVV